MWSFAALRRYAEALAINRTAGCDISNIAGYQFRAADVDGAMRTIREDSNRANVVSTVAEWASRAAKRGDLPTAARFFAGLKRNDHPALCHTTIQRFDSSTCRTFTTCFKISESELDASIKRRSGGCTRSAGVRAKRLSRGPRAKRVSVRSDGQRWTRVSLVQERPRAHRHPTAVAFADSGFHQVLRRRPS